MTFYKVSFNSDQPKPSKRSRAIAQAAVLGALFLFWNIIVTGIVSFAVSVILGAVGYNLSFEKIFAILISAQFIFGLFNNDKKQ